MPAGAHGF